MKSTYEGLVLDRFQREAMAAIEREEDVVVAAPTGAGKTLIAHFAIERALAAGKRAVYTAPIKALSNQKFRDLSEAFPGQVGISTGDVSINAGAPVVIMTTEIFRNTIFEDPARIAEIGWVIFDEVHYLDDPERGTVWEESLIFAPRGVRVLALSATVSNLDEFAAWIREVRESTVQVVLEQRRPVPLEVFVCSTEGGDVRPLEQMREVRLGRAAFKQRSRERQRDLRSYYERAQEKLVERVAEREELPLLFFLFSRAACERLAVAVGGRHDFMPSAEAARAAADDFMRLAAAFELDLSDPEIAQVRRLIERGIAYHHAGILPALKEVIERLFTDGHVRLLCATETFALGVNMPARSVAFEGLMRWDGKARVPLKTREYQQMAGRAGRRGIDTSGSVFLLFDPFRDDRRMFLQTVNGRVEPVASQFNLSYGTLLNLYQRLGEELYEACARSFANFRAKRRQGAAVGAGIAAGGEAGAPRASGGVVRGPARGRGEGPPPVRVERRGVHRDEDDFAERGHKRGYNRGRRGRRAAERAEEGQHPGRGPSERHARAGAEREERRGGRSGQFERGPRRGGRPGRFEREERRGGRPGRFEREERDERGAGRERANAPTSAAPAPRAGGGRYADIVEQVRLKMGVLAELGYIDSQGQITERGRFAMQVFGHELEIAELVWSKALDGLTAGQIAVMMAAVVFEARKGVYYGGGDPKRLVGKQAYRLAHRAVGSLVALEVERGVRAPSKLLDWDLSGVVAAWVDGAEFAELRELTDASDGDVVRALRQTIQALRLTRKPLRAMGRADLAAKVRAAQRLLKRGLVDAEWQLRKSAELEGEEELDWHDELDEEEAAVEAAAREAGEAPGEAPSETRPPERDPDWDPGFSEGIL